MLHATPAARPRRPASEVLLAFSRLLAEAEEPDQVYQATAEAAGELTGALAAEIRGPAGGGGEIVLNRWEATCGASAVPSVRSPAGKSVAPEPEAGCSLTLCAAGRHFGRILLVGPACSHELAAVLAAQAAMALAHLEARRQLRRSLLQTVTALAALVESKDEYTENHCTRIAEMALQVGIRFDLPPHRLDQLTYAAILHDIGKVGIPDALLLKPGPLSEAEAEVMRRHPVIGRQVLERVDFLQKAATIVEQHHERYDGHGYPLGLRGEEILLEARILSVADAYDAMVTTRPYRRALSQEEAVAELRRGAGTQFDPKVVETFIELVKAGL